MVDDQYTIITAIRGNSKMNKKIWHGAWALIVLTGTATANAAEEEKDEAESRTAASEAPQEDGENQGRFRWGISGLGGPYMGAYKGGAGGLDLRFGWQLNDNIGIVAQPHLALGFGAQSDENSASISATALSGVGGLADYTVADFFYAGAGLGVSTGGFASGSISSSSGSAQVADGPFFDVPFRIGIALGSKKPSRRNAFTIGINGHLLFVSSDVSTAQSDGTVTNEKKLGVVALPLISLGYESF